MRLSNSTSNTLATYREESRNGTPTIASFTGKCVVASSAKHDITKVVADASGWRYPTEYGSSFTETAPWYGTVSWLDDYDTWGGGTDFIKKTFIGHLEELDATLFPNHKPPPLVHPAVTESLVYQRAVNKALVNLKDQQVQYATFLAESGEAASMLLKNARKLANSMRLIRKGRFKDAANELRISSKVFKSNKRPRTENEVSARWLEAQYGWLPLMSDMYGAYEDARKGFFREPRISTKGKATDESRKDYPLSTYLYSGTNTFHCIQSCFVRLDYVLDSPRLQIAANKGLTNPLEVAWELVPYSFVADWFLPIGEFISCLDADFGVIFRGGSYTTYERYESLGVIRPRPWTDGEGHRYLVSGQLTSRKFNLDIMRRTYKVSPGGSFYMKNPLSLAHAANAVALIHQTFKGR